MFEKARQDRALFINLSARAGVRWSSPQGRHCPSKPIFQEAAETNCKPHPRRAQKDGMKVYITTAERGSRLIALKKFNKYICGKTDRSFLRLVGASEVWLGQGRRRPQRPARRLVPVLDSASLRARMSCRAGAERGLGRACWESAARGEPPPGLIRTPAQCLAPLPSRPFFDNPLEPVKFNMDRPAAAVLKRTSLPPAEHSHNSSIVPGTAAQSAN
ncbi:hypothetical protein SKAU_G00144190 [Synaphobranchus kaupii]|uniref:Uncharacterized protein n=1 Tax=Synaphobranchus kaupii TaxID=118154 RepID=A0A9Q1FTY5_SYNKA|nr:hypothetical protein SKAU_G00144190 [Synaphobranchus kaupii]